MSARERVAKLAVRNPTLVRLAEDVSLAVQVDPVLLRTARRRLVGATVEHESRLWFSSLVGGRSTSGFVFSKAAVMELRTRLEQRGSEALEAAWTLVDELHRHLPGAIRLEEEVTYLAIRGDDEKLGNRLSSALHALREPEREGLELWAQRALDRAPEAVTRSRVGQLIQSEVALIEAGAARQKSGDWTERVTLLKGSESFLVRVVGETLELGELSSGEGEQLVTTVRSDPALLEVRWTGPDGHERSVLKPWSPFRVTLVHDVTLPLQLRFADGNAVELREASEVDAPQPVEEDARRVVILHHPDDRAWAVYLRQNLIGVKAWSVDVLEGPREVGEHTDALVLATPSMTTVPMGAHPLWTDELEMTPLRFPGVPWPDSAQRMLLDADAPLFGLTDALEHIELRVDEESVPPALPGQLDDPLRFELEDVLDRLGFERVRALFPFLDTQTSPRFGAYPLWGAVLRQRAPRNALVCLAALLGLRESEGGVQPSGLHRALDPGSSYGPGANWLRRSVRVEWSGVASRSAIGVDPKYLDGITQRTSFELRDALDDGSIRATLERLRLESRFGVRTDGPAVLTLLEGVPSAVPFELSSRSPYIRSNPGLVRRTRGVHTNELAHWVIGRVQPLLHVGDIVSRRARELRGLMAGMPVADMPNVLVVETAASEAASVLRELPFEMARDGLLFLRAVMTNKRPEDGFSIPELLEAATRFCAERGPDTVILRISPDRDRRGTNRSQQTFLDSILDGTPIGDALIEAYPKDPYPWFVWSDPLLTLDVSPWLLRNDNRSRYYRPPAAIPPMGRRVDRAGFGAMTRTLRRGEVLVAHGRPKGTYTVSTYVGSKMRFDDIERSWRPTYYAVALQSLLGDDGSWDKPFSDRELDRIRR